MKLGITLALVLSSQVALAAPAVRVEPTTAKPGDAVLVTVRGATEAPKGKAAGDDLRFFRAKGGYQAVFAVPLDAKPEPIKLTVAGEAVTLAIREVTFPESGVRVDEEYANPPAEARKQVDEDNTQTLGAMVKAGTEPQFTAAFRKPRGKVTSSFGEWRTFNDGHRSQHLGTDFTASQGAKVPAVNAGIVALVRETFLGGKIVVVAHGAGISSAYFHLSRTDVKEGDPVKLGETVGLAGKTGRATGPHVHLAIRVPGGLVDPASFFKLKLAPAAPKAARR
jgi:murein DD-endopeptidase MepM/ murein hydrolase activator NlpD